MEKDIQIQNLEKKNRLFTGLSIGIFALQTVVSGILMRFLPDEIPLHFDSAGKTDRFGSKYELYIFLVLSLIAIVVWIGIRKDALEKIKKEEDVKKRTSYITNAYVFGLCQVCFVLVMAVVEMSLFVSGFKNTDPVVEIAGPEPVIMIIDILTGLMLIAFGNVMPKSRINNTFGVRTSWSSYNEEVWAKTNRFGGIAGIVSGIVIILAAVFVPWRFSIATLLIVICIMAVCDVVASYVYYKQAKSKEE